VLAVSTAGASPVLAARICREAAAGVDPVLPMLADLLEAWRAQLKAAIPDLLIRRALLQRLAGEEMEGVLRKNGAEAAQREFQNWFAGALAEAAARPATAVAAVPPTGQPTGASTILTQPTRASAPLAGASAPLPKAPGAS
jgi:hypothetical protein